MKQCAKLALLSEKCKLAGLMTGRLIRTWKPVKAVLKLAGGYILFEFPTPGVWKSIQEIYRFVERYWNLL